jgi:hypothetical protein
LARLREDRDRARPKEGEVMDLERVDAGAGLLGAVLGFVGSTLVFSTLPREDAPVEKYLSFVVDKRGQILAGVMMFAVATGLLLWWANGRPGSGWSPRS